MKLRFWIAAVLLCWSLNALSAEVEHRDQLKNEFAAAFARSDFVQIESRYAKALSTQERSPSGRFLAHAWMRAMGFADKDDPNWEAAEEKTRKWVAQYPKSVLAVIAHSRIHNYRAWNARGRGYASTVTEEGWKKFALHMNRATEALASRAEAGKTDPNWWYEMLDQAREQSWPQQRYWKLAYAALQAFPQNHDIYRAIALKLVPQWGGSWQALAAFADEAVARTRQTQGQTMYARVYWNVALYFEPGLLTRPEGNWPKFRAGFEELVARYPDRWNLSKFAAFACDAGDKDTTRRLLTRINDAVVPAAWENRATYNRCRSWATS